MSSRLVSIAILFLTTLSGITACGRKPSATIQPAVNSGTSFTVQGEYELHYNAVRSDQLSADIARNYGVTRSKNRVLLNISVLHKTDAGKAVDADVTANSRNLAGQGQGISLRRIGEGNAIYYLGEVVFSGTQTLIFDIAATPAGSTIPIKASLTREFSTEF